MRFSIALFRMDLCIEVFSVKTVRGVFRGLQPSKGCAANGV